MIVVVAVLRVRRRTRGCRVVVVVDEKELFLSQPLQQQKVVRPPQLLLLLLLLLRFLFRLWLLLLLLLVLLCRLVIEREEANREHVSPRQGNVLDGKVKKKSPYFFNFLVSLQLQTSFVSNSARPSSSNS